MFQMDFGGCVKTTCGYGGCTCGETEGGGGVGRAGVGGECEGAIETEIPRALF